MYINVPKAIAVKANLLNRRFLIAGPRYSSIVNPIVAVRDFNLIATNDYKVNEFIRFLSVISSTDYEKLRLKTVVFRPSKDGDFWVIAVRAS